MFFRKYAGVLAVSSIVAVAAPAAAQSGTTGQQLASSKNCLACHQIDSKRVGPAFNVIAQRFVNQDGAADYLAATIRSGGRGRWVPFPCLHNRKSAPTRHSNWRPGYFHLPPM